MQGEPNHKPDEKSDIPPAGGEISLGSLIGTKEGRYSQDYSQRHPILADFQAVDKDPAARFDRRCMIFPGNNGAIVHSVVRPRGFTRVNSVLASRVVG